MRISGPGIEAAFAFASITAPASKLAGDPEEAA
jgi:hypothetical protein